MFKSKVKALCITFFDCRGLIMEEWMPTGQTVNAIYYCEVMCKLHERFRKKRPELWKNGFAIHHDDMPSHTEFIVRNFLT